MRRLLVFLCAVSAAACGGGGGSGSGGGAGSTGGGAGSAGGGTASSGGGSASAGGGSASSGGGASTGGGSGGGLVNERPERVVASSDNSAFLWIPDGGALATAPITIEARDGGYRLLPEGQTFERPAFLFFPLPPGTDSDGGHGFFSARLVSADGGSEPARTLRAAAVGHSGPALGVGVVEVSHFTDVVVETVPPGAQRAEGVIAVLEPQLKSQTFDREVGSPPWLATMGLIRPPSVDAGSAFVGQYVVAAEGSVQVVPGTPDVGLPQAVNLNVREPESATFALKCVSVGPGSVTVTVFTSDFSHALSVTHSGNCRQKPVVAAVDPTKAAAAGDVLAATPAFIASIQWALTHTSPRLSASEAGSAATKTVPKVAPVPRAPPPPPYTATWTLGCTDCPLNVEYTGHLDVTNTTGTPGLMGADVTSGGSTVAKVSAVLGGMGITETTDGIHAGPYDISSPPTASVPFTFTCTRDGTLNLQAMILAGYNLAYIFGTPSFTEATVRATSPIIKCGIGGDAIMLSDNAKVSRADAGYTVAAPGVTANLIHAHDDVRAKFYPSAPGTSLYSGVATFKSNSGLSPILLKSGRQTGTATFNGTRYAITGLVGGAAFNATDSLTVEHTPSGMPTITLTVPAPPPLADINAFFGPRQGLKTEVRIPDGTFDTFFVSVVGGPPGGPAGQTGVLRQVKAADMTLTSGNRVAPVLDDETIAALNALGWSVQTLYIAYYRQQDTQLFFPSMRSLPVQAGRMFQVNAADLAP